MFDNNLVKIWLGVKLGRREEIMGSREVLQKVLDV